MSATRTEHDSFGTIEVPADALWGGQTARSLHFFAIGAQRMPVEIIHALGWIKWAAARVNCDLELLPAARAQVIADAARRVATGELDAQFPLSVWQTGSGTQSNMNVNEVIASLANQSLRSAGSTEHIHPNDDVNLGQSSNDAFPSAMHMAVVRLATQHLLPSLAELHETLNLQAVRFRDAIKLGRTHLQDATPVTLGQEFGGYAAQLAMCEASIRHALQAVHALALGGTAVGTGLNTHPQFGERVSAMLASELGLPLVRADNLFAALAGFEALVAFHSGLKMLAIALTKIANDLRLMGSGPRAGLGELLLPENEPGSSIMPSKVNPTQIEALTMVCIQVLGHDVAVGMAASQGQLELNVYRPLVALNVLDSVRLLADAMRSFSLHCVAGIEVNEVRTRALLEGSLMLVTALVPHIGYDRAAAIARRAQSTGSSLREAAVADGGITNVQFDQWVNPRKMLSNT